MKQLLLVIVFTLFLNVTFAQKVKVDNVDECTQVLKNGFESCPLCPAGSNDSYVVIIKNTCNYPIDISVGIKQTDETWKYNYRPAVKGGDTIYVFSCNGIGKSRKSFRKAGAAIMIDSCESYNADYIKKTGKNPCAATIATATNLKNIKTVDIYAKLLKGEKLKTPVTNQKVLLKNNKGEKVSESTTDQFGDFSFLKVNETEPMDIFIEKGNNIANDEKIYLAKQNGIIIGEAKQDDKGNFDLKLLPSDINLLMKVEAEDPFLQLVDFKKTAKKEIVITDMVYYKQESWELNEEAKKVLDKVIKTLSENPEMQVELMSHSDSRGDDSKNMNLSEKRAQSAVQYIISKKIDAKRISGKGFGESKILNRCGNGVNCSEQEHQLNRRTEFRFYKK